ncbi:MAG: VWA domain-containing protein [Akkermansiaceae bacterium]
MPIQFQAPEWFLLAPTLLIAGWFWKNLEIYRPLRMVLIAVSAFLLADPSIRKQQDALDLYVLLDRSESTEDLVDQGLPEWQRLLEKSKPSSRDELHMINYAAEIAPLGADGAVFTGSRKLTRTNLALQTIATLAKEDKPARVLLFTDGYSTEPLHEATAQLQARGIPVDFRLIRENIQNDFRVARLDFPDRVQAGEPFLLSVTVRGSKDGDVPLTLMRNQQPLTETKVTLTNGVGKVEFTDRIPRAGSFEYSAQITPLEDQHSGNNRLSRWIEITGGPRVLLVTRYQDDPLAKILTSLNFTVEIVSELSQLSAGKLSGTRAVILNNVPAHEVPKAFLEALPFYVYEQGGGLMMAGGDRSFGSGGYFESAIDPLLPVSMELKSEHRKLAVALAIVMDRSGSMGVSVAPGKTKIDLANQGAVNAIQLLGNMDQVAVIAVDSEPETFVPITQINGKQEALCKVVRKVQSSGGGIYVYEGLKAGWDALKKSNAGTRHLILFTDTADTEEPGDYKRLIKQMTDQGATISVIGMGTPADPDAKLCEEIAKLGKGRMFYSDKPMDIPKIFAQETVTIARSAFIEDPTKTKQTGRWAEVSPQPLQWLGAVDGYNLSYAREDSTVSLVSSDEYLAPLVATARRGLGRTAAISFPLGGKKSDATRQWPEYANFLQTTTRWLMGLDLPPGIGLKQQSEGSRLTLNLLYDPELWSEQFQSNPPKIRILESNADSQSYDLPWRRIAPGRFSVSRDLEEGAIVRGAIQVGTYAIPFGPITLGSSIEWAFEPEAISELRAASKQTGGRELLDLTSAWLRPPFIQDTSLRFPLLLLLLGLLLVEALITRTGWKLPAFAGRIPRVKTPRIRTKKATVPSVIEEPIMVRHEEKPVQPVHEIEESARRSRFQRAKDRK